MLSNFELASHKGAPCYVRFTDIIYSPPYKKEFTAPLLNKLEFPIPKVAYFEKQRGL